MKTKLIHISWLVLSILFFLKCTEHPFGNNDIKPPNRQINGKVGLNDGFNSQGVYVWLEGFDIGTFVDENETFQLTLPARHLQVAPGGVTGAFRIYFYMANYYLTTRNVVTRGGDFLYSQGDLGKTGALKGSVELEKFLNVTTKIAPASVKVNQNQSLSITIILKTFGSSVNVRFPEKEQGKQSPIILKQIDSDDYSVFETKYQDDISTWLIRVNEDPLIRTMVLNLSADQSLPQGKYRIIPYFFIQHDRIPLKLLESLGPGLENIDENYFNNPLHVLSDTLTVY